MEDRDNLRREAGFLRAALALILPIMAIVLVGAGCTTGQALASEAPGTFDSSNDAIATVLAPPPQNSTPPTIGGTAASSAQTAIVACSARQSSYSGVISSTPGLVGYWRLGESSGTVACDSTAQPDNGTYLGGFSLG